EAGTRVVKLSYETARSPFLESAMGRGKVLIKVAREVSTACDVSVARRVDCYPRSFGRMAQVCRVHQSRAGGVQFGHEGLGNILAINTGPKTHLERARRCGKVE